MLLMAASLSLASCNAIDSLFTSRAVKQPKPFVQAVPDTAITPDAAPNGWRPVRSTPTEILWLPPLVQPAPRKVKVKNSHNTDNSQKKSHNMETKAKGEAIVGDGNAPVEAGKKAVMGDGNTTRTYQSLWWLWMLLGALVLFVAWAWWKRDFG